MFWKVGTRFKFNKHAFPFIFLVTEESSEYCAVHRKGLFLYPASNAVLHHWWLLLVYGFQTSSATPWFLFLKLSYKNMLQNTRWKSYKAMMYCICASPPSPYLSFCPWKDEEWFEIVFEISVLIDHVPHIGDRKALAFHFLYHKVQLADPSHCGNASEFFHLDDQLSWWSVDSMLPIPTCCFVCLLITPTSLL